MLEKLYRKSELYLKRNSATILTCLGGAGVLLTVIAAVRATPKALKRLERATYDKCDDLTKFEVVKVAGACYIPTVMFGLSTIACIFGANILNKNRQAAITSAYILLNQSYKEYKNKTSELYGPDADTNIRHEIAKDKYKKYGKTVDSDKILFYESLRDEYFESTMEDVISAEYHFNRNFALRGYADLNEFYSFLGLSETKQGSILGWSLEAGAAFYGYSWVDFKHELVVMDDGLECYIITMPFEPTMDFEDEELLYS